MTQDKLIKTSTDDLRAAYNEVCNAYHRIDDFRSMLLGLLPLVSGTGIFLLLDPELIKAIFSSLDPQNLTSILRLTGVFGGLITVGLYFYELRGIQTCNKLIGLGAGLENDMRVSGFFVSRSQLNPILGVIDVTRAAFIIYSTVIAAWIFLFFYPCGALFGALIAGLGFIFSIVISCLLDKKSQLGRISVQGWITALGDTKEEVRRNAIYALRQIGLAAVPELITALGDTKEEVRSGAAETLGQIGLAAAGANLGSQKRC